jgi:hypothetical protein
MHVKHNNNTYFCFSTCYMRNYLIRKQKHGQIFIRHDRGTLLEYGVMYVYVWFEVLELTS